MAEIGTKINTHVTKQQLYVVSAKVLAADGREAMPCRVPGDVGMGSLWGPLSGISC